MTKQSIPSAIRTPRAREFWRNCTESFELDTPGEQALLIELCMSLDRLEECAAVLKKDGLTTRGHRGVVAHPLVRVELQHRDAVLRIARTLGVHSPLRGVGEE